MIKTRFSRFFYVLALIFINLVSLNIAVAQDKGQQTIWVAGADAGIYRAVLDLKTGALGDISQVVTKQNTDYIVKHPHKDILYSVGRPSSKTSSVRSYLKSSEDGLILQSEKKNRGADGAHINISSDGKLLAVAYYTGGDIDVYAINKDGSIGKLLLNAKHSGSSINKNRQNEAHPHWVGFSHDNRFLYVPDLGTDHVWIYKVHKQKITLAHKIASTPGAGPRHLVFHPSLPFAYVADELSSGVTSYSVNKKTGALSALESIPSAKETENESWHSVSDIRIHPSGRFLYLVNRGFDQVSVFSIDQQTGKLSAVEREPVRGSISRNIVITEDGKWALVVSKLTNSLAVFEVNKKTGELTFKSGHIYPMTTPRAIAFD